MSLVVLDETIEITRHFGCENMSYMFHVTSVVSINPEKPRGWSEKLEFPIVGGITGGFVYVRVSLMLRYKLEKGHNSSVKN
jgi:hypothetical protein